MTFSEEYLAEALGEPAEVTPMWTLSTGHLRELDSKLLAECGDTSMPVICAPWTPSLRHGDIVYVPDEELDADIGWMADLQEAGFSQDFQHICKLAQLADISFIKFDESGPTMAALPTFDW